MAEPEDVEVWDRTSGGEDEEQDAEAQAATTAQRFMAAGFIVARSTYDEDTPGDTPWDERPRMRAALDRARALGRVFGTRSPSRLWRGRPSVGLALAETIPDLEVLGKPHWSRRASAWVDDSDAADLYRYLDLWQAWTGKRGIREETQHVMTAIKRGDRKTKSGRPPGRPEVAIDPAHVEEARRLREEGASWTDVHARVLELRGYNAVKDTDAKARRWVSVDTVKRALGAKPRPGQPGQNADPGKTRDGPANPAPEANGPLVPGTERARTGNTHDREVIFHG